jgi:hypothetical protein
MMDIRDRRRNADWLTGPHRPADADQLLATPHVQLAQAAIALTRSRPTQDLAATAHRLISQTSNASIDMAHIFARRSGQIFHRTRIDTSTVSP